MLCCPQGLRASLGQTCAPEIAGGPFGAVHLPRPWATPGCRAFLGCSLAAAGFVTSLSPPGHGRVAGHMWSKAHTHPARVACGLILGLHD